MVFGVGKKGKDGKEKKGCSIFMGRAEPGSVRRALIKTKSVEQAAG